MVAALPSSGCLVTEGPSFEKPPRTAPRIIPFTSTAEVRHVVAAGTKYEIPPFDYKVAGEDADQPVRSVLLINYGVSNDPNTRWRDAIGAPVIQPGTITDPPRPFDHYASIKWITHTAREPPACYTATLLVTHEFRSDYPLSCPADLTDYDSATWVVALCGPTVAVKDCHPVDCPRFGDPDAKYCESPTETKP